MALFNWPGNPWVEEEDDDIIDNLNELSGDYMISRYPDVSGMVPYEEYDREIAVEKINVAKFIFEKLKDRYRRMEVKHE